MLSIAVALWHLHSKRISHFDVKCANILLDKTGQAKLADVGLSRFLKADETAVTSLGTPAYAAPEQHCGLSAGTAADIWAFGVTLWEVSTSQKGWPYTAVLFLQVLNLVLRRISTFEDCQPQTIILCRVLIVISNPRHVL